jgi:hypothetical protein
MPRYHRPLHDKDGNVVGHTTHVRRFEPCSSPGCTGDGVVLCDFPIPPSQREKSCDRRICTEHAHTVGNGKRYCPPHARISTNKPELWNAGVDRKPEPAQVVTDEELCDLSDGASDSGMAFREPHMSGRGTIEIDDSAAAFFDVDDSCMKPTMVVHGVDFVDEENFAALGGAADVFDNADMALLDKLLVADDGLRLKADERQSFQSMRQRLDEDAGRSLTPKQLAWAQRTLAELEQNAADLTLLEEAIGEAETRGLGAAYEAFQSMVERIGVRYPLSEKQRAWAQGVADGD